MDRYEFEGPDQNRWIAERTGAQGVRFSLSVEGTRPRPANMPNPYSDVIGPELLRVAEERDQLREKVKTLDDNLIQAGRDIRTLEAEARELGEKVDTLEKDRAELWIERDKLREDLAAERSRRRDLEATAERQIHLIRKAEAEARELEGKLGAERSLDREQEMWVQEGEVRGYARAEADIRALIARRVNEAQDAAARSGDAEYDLWHARAAGLSALLGDIGHGLHRLPGLQDLSAAPAAPEMMDTPDGPQPLPDSIDAAAYAFPETAPNPAGGAAIGYDPGGPPFRNNLDRLSEITPMPLTTADVRGMRQELAARMGPERPAGAFEKGAPAPAELEGWLARLEGRAEALEKAVENRITAEEWHFGRRSIAIDAERLMDRVVALEKAVGEITVTSEATLLDLKPLRRLAASCRSVGHVTAQSVEEALREAGVIPGE